MRSGIVGLGVNTRTCEEQRRVTTGNVGVTMKLSGQKVRILSLKNAESEMHS